MRWLFTGKGMLTYSPSIVAASVKVLEEAATPDMQVAFAPGSFKGGQIGELEEMPGLSAHAWQMRPLSRSYVEARSNRPVICRRSTRVTCQKKPIGAPSSAVCAWRGGCSPPRAAAVRPRGGPPGHAGADRRRVARLRAA
jgi:hypothetical protein